MLKKTKGLVISHLKYRDTSIIAKIFTREVGVKSYLVNGIRSAKSRPKIALYQPLTLLDLVVYDRENRNLHHISESRLELPFSRIPFDFHRSGVALFMAEVMGRALPDEYQNQELYDFLQRAVIRLDGEDINLSGYPLGFLLWMARYLGFGPEDGDHFYEQLPTNQASQNHLHKVNVVNKLIQHENSFASLPVPTTLRRALMEDLILFYQIHLDGFGAIKSLEVLRSMM